MKINKLNEKETGMLEGLINETIVDYLRGGCGLKDEYVITYRNILKKLGLIEIYNFEDWSVDDE